ncbi:FG-GAP repeat domain-containing protein [Nanoarchaeota archaeon]
MPESDVTAKPCVSCVRPATIAGILGILGGSILGTLGTCPGDAVPSDVNQDGLADMVVCNESLWSSFLPLPPKVFLQQGDGQYIELGQYFSNLRSQYDGDSRQEFLNSLNSEKKEIMGRAKEALKEYKAQN